MRATKNIEQELQRFQAFSTKVLAPVLGAMAIAETKYAKPITITERNVRDAYGLSASKCFSLLFKRLQRGGYSDRYQTAFQSTWVPSPDAVSAYLQWIDSNPAELTCRALLLTLESIGIEQLQWNRDAKAWVASDLVRAARKAAGDIVEVEDNTNYGHLKTVIIKNTEAVGALA